MIFDNILPFPVSQVTLPNLVDASALDPVHLDSLTSNTTTHAALWPDLIRNPMYSAGLARDA